ncbi:cyclic nucleotide-binding domain-containing protein [Magnetococcales bacterium HHB-1]
MRKALMILGQLNDEDAEWLAQTGQKRQILAGERLIEEGEPITALFIILAGKMSVEVSGGHEIATLEAGEMLGEISFVNQSRPVASVSALSTTTILEISRQNLDEKLRLDTAFAARFFRAISIFLADRLQHTVRRLGYGPSSRMAEEEASLEEELLDDQLLNSMGQAGERFQHILRLLSCTQ